MSRSHSENGMIMVAVISIIVFLSIMLMGMFSLASSNLVRARSRVYMLEAQYAAESGADAAIATFNSGNESYTGTAGAEVQVLDADFYKATYSVSVAAGSTSKEKIITAIGRVYSPKNAATAGWRRTIKVIAQRSATETASSIVSRNILALDSGIKNLSAKDLIVNGYITMAKNTTNLIAENITVAGKNTGASNCSIGGSGNLVKPSSFSNPGQTKTNLTLAYNNCISPPGNSSNASFNVSANQGTITTVQSTYIPWNQYMDSSYTAAGNCNDWTATGTTKNIPSVSGSKKTHYPDSSSNVSTSCGSSGDLSLGSATYNLNDNAHVRASLCATTACTPTFNNPSSSTTRYLFVEGSVNFDSVQTASGSGPIVIIAYGADPSSKTSVCPYGGSMYLGNSGTTSAPKLYMLATNGICLDKTKFSTNPALGGIGGKNIWVATNSGSPFDLALDNSFPVTNVPLDLTWRAVYYVSL